MTKKTKDTPESSPPPTADDSGAFSVDPKSMGAMAPIVPLLKKSVDHMKKSNEYVKTTNQELIKLNRSMVRQVRLLWVLALTSLLLICGFIFALCELHELGVRLDAQLVQQTTTNGKLAEVVVKLEAVDKKTKETKDAIDEQPKFSVKPADTTDPSSKPTLIVVPPTSDKRPPRPKGVEIPFDLSPKHKK